MDKKVISDFLSKVELFKDLSKDEIELISEHAECKSFESGHNIFKENNPRKCLYIIYEGEVELYKTTPFGDEKRLSFFGKYNFLGEGSLLGDSPHATSARALLKAKTISISRDNFISFVKNHPDTGLKIFSHIASVMSRRMKQSNTRAINASAQYESGWTRSEHDLLGTRDVPAEYYYGIQTQRALENFNISGITLNFYPVLIQALAMKWPLQKLTMILGCSPNQWQMPFHRRVWKLLTVTCITILPSI